MPGIIGAAESSPAKTYEPPSNHADTSHIFADHIVCSSRVVQPQFITFLYEFNAQSWAYFLRQTDKPHILPAGRAAGARRTANHFWGGHWGTMILVGGLAGVIGYGDPIVAPLHQEAFRSNLIGQRGRARQSHPTHGDVDRAHI